MLPLIQAGRGDPEGPAQRLDCHGTGKIQFQDMEDEGQRVLPVRDNEIREQRMRAPAGTQDPSDLYDAPERLPTRDVYDVAFINGKRTALSPGTTVRTAFPGRGSRIPELVQFSIRNEKKEDLA